MAEILQDQKDIDAIHVIGHGSAGQIVFGDAYLNNQTVEQYQSSLESIGQALTEAGDILFYACNVAADEAGDLLLSKISEYTKADIAASDDITGKSGDWELEKKIGVVETQNVQVIDYQSNLLQDGVSSINGKVTELPSATLFTSNKNAAGGDNTSGFGGAGQFFLTLEKSNITTSMTISKNSNVTNTISATPSFDYMPSGSSYTVSSTNAVASYLFGLNMRNNNDDTNDRHPSDAAVVTFENEIVGVYVQGVKTIGNSTFSKSGATYPTSSDPDVTGDGRDTETSGNGNSFDSSDPSGSSNADGKGGDWFTITNNNKTITFGAENGNPGDFLRVITKWNRDPSATNDTGYIQEGKTLTVADNVSENDADSSSNTNDATGDHSGDILKNDTDADSDSLTITTYSHSS